MFEILITLSFENFLSAPLQSPIPQKLLEGDEKIFLRFEADEIAFNFKFLFPWRPLDSKIKVISIFEKHALKSQKNKNYVNFM